MELIITDTYNELSLQAAAEVIRLMQMYDQPLLCAASGDTPAGLYKKIVDKIMNNEADATGWFFTGLDEWEGMNESDEGSCRYYIDTQLFHPLHIAGSHITFFDGRAGSPEAECDAVENFIRQHGGIDVAILGLGMNGHIGMNEPGTPASLRSHVTLLDPVTQSVGQKYFSTRQSLTRGLTLGPATLLESRHILLLVSGAHKARIVKKVLEEAISEQLPASLLRHHPGLKIYLDKEAASLL